MTKQRLRLRTQVQNIGVKNVLSDVEIVGAGRAEDDIETLN